MSKRGKERGRIKRERKTNREILVTERGERDESGGGGEGGGMEESKTEKEKKQERGSIMGWERKGEGVEISIVSKKE